MRSRIAKIFLLFVGLLLVGTSALAGCAGGGGQEKVVVGFLGDFTGPSASTCDELKKGMDDYLTIMNENNPIPGVDIGVITFDSRLDYGRVKPGYVDLKNRGSDIILDFNSMYTVQIWQDHQNDQLPSFCFNSMPEVMGKDYMFSFSNDYVTEAESIGEWLVRDWWEIRGETRPINIGYIATLGLRSNTEYGDVLQSQADASPNKMKLTWTAIPQGQSSGFVAEINKLKDCDVIIVNLVGPSMASFLKEARDRGYTGEFFGTTISFMGFWNLVRASIADLSAVDGARAIHAQMVWTDQTDFVSEIDAALTRFHSGSELEKLRSSTSYPSGYLFMMILADVIRGAADRVGAQNVNGVAIWEAAKELKLNVDGFGETWEMHPGSNILHRPFRIIEFRHDADNWFQVEGTDWFLPTAFQ